MCTYPYHHCQQTKITALFKEHNLCCTKLKSNLKASATHNIDYLQIQLIIEGVFDYKDIISNIGHFTYLSLINKVLVNILFD